MHCQPSSDNNKRQLVFIVNFNHKIQNQMLEEGYDDETAFNMSDSMQFRLLGSSRFELENIVRTLGGINKNVCGKH